MDHVCVDNRSEIIERYKNELISATNIESSPDEMAVLDNILFRFWQMGWLKEQEPKTGHWIDSAGYDGCSVCGATYSDLYPDYQYTHYCPNCGAKMIVYEEKLE